MNDFAQAGFDPAASPQVRTLLLTDLCDSTMLVERLGDGPAAELFRAHDRLVLELQQRWRGRLIDRSDGLLLLFERPIDGLGFALDYSRGLRELGDRPEVRDRKLSLLARAGLHVGEVLTWQNSESAVQAGAKPLEVEGLAKPLAGRLMTLARPGQILLSATAEPLARRAARELGERADHLIWKSHGRWRFKGVPDGQEVFEVGEPGFAPLRAPKGNSGKAWRDIPVWRRPAALAAELFLVAGLATGAWFITRPTPAIAFNERDWVVVGDLRNLTGDPVLDASLEQAFRISLEQSRYVNVLSDLKVRDTLTLMKKAPETTLDRAIASEIAIRDGARAVILPTVAEVGGRVRVSAEVIDPNTQTTVYAESADGVGAESTLDSIDSVTSELREKLGEAIASIDRDSAPLPQVSTENLDALKAYALGVSANARGDADGAKAYFRQALQTDPNFALALAALGGVHLGEGETVEGRRALESAIAMKDHLTPREAMRVQAVLARFGPVRDSLRSWERLAAMYPDLLLARQMLSQDGWMFANLYAQMLPHAKAATVSQNPYHAMSQYMMGILYLGQDNYAEAVKAFEASRKGGFQGAGAMYAHVYGAQRKFAQADRIYASRGGSGHNQTNLAELEFALQTAVDRGQWTEAKRIVAQGIAVAAKDDTFIDAATWRVWAANIDAVTGELRPELLREQLRWVADQQATIDRTLAVSQDFRVAIGYLAARAGHRDIVDEAITSIAAPDTLKARPLAWQGYEVLLAERARLHGKPADAIDRLSDIASGDDALAIVHSALFRAYAAGKRPSQARRQAEWLAGHRGRIYVERGTSSLLDMINIADSTLALLDIAEASKAAGDDKRKQQAAVEFARAWPANDLPRPLRERVAAL